MWYLNYLNNIPANSLSVSTWASPVMELQQQTKTMGSSAVAKTWRTKSSVVFKLNLPSPFIYSAGFKHLPSLCNSRSLPRGLHSPLWLQSLIYAGRFQICISRSAFPWGITLCIGHMELEQIETNIEKLLFLPHPLQLVDKSYQIFLQSSSRVCPSLLTSIPAVFQGFLISQLE